MTQEEKVAYINAQVVCAQAEIAALNAENFAAMMQDQVPPNPPEFFHQVPLKYGIHHNAVLTFFHH